MPTRWPQERHDDQRRHPTRPAGLSLSVKPGAGGSAGVAASSPRVSGTETDSTAAMATVAMNAVPGLSSSDDNENRDGSSSSLAIGHPSAVKLLAASFEEAHQLPSPCAGKPQVPGSNSKPATDHQFPQRSRLTSHPKQSEGEALWPTGKVPPPIPPRQPPFGGRIWEGAHHKGLSQQATRPPSDPSHYHGRHSPPSGVSKSYQAEHQGHKLTSSSSHPHQDSFAGFPNDSDVTYSARRESDPFKDPSRETSPVADSQLLAHDSNPQARVENSPQAHSHLSTVLRRRSQSETAQNASRVPSQCGPNPWLSPRPMDFSSFEDRLDGNGELCDDMPGVGESSPSGGSAPPIPPRPRSFTTDNAAVLLTSRPQPLGHKSSQTDTRERPDRKPPPQKPLMFPQSSKHRFESSSAPHPKPSKLSPKGVSKSHSDPTGLSSLADTSFFDTLTALSRQVPIKQDISSSASLNRYAPEMSFSNETPPFISHLSHPLTFTKNAVRCFILHGNFAITGHRDHTCLSWIPNGKVISVLNHPDLKATAAVWRPTHLLKNRYTICWLGFNNGEIWAVDMFGVTPRERRRPETPVSFGRTTVPVGSMPKLDEPCVLERARPAQTEILWMRNTALRVVFLDKSGKIGSWQYNHDHELSLETTSPKTSPTQISGWSSAFAATASSLKQNANLDEDQKTIIANIVKSHIWIGNHKLHTIEVFSVAPNTIGDHICSMALPVSIGPVSCIAFGGETAVRLCTPVKTENLGEKFLAGHAATGHECGRVVIWDVSHHAILLVVPIAFYAVSAIHISNCPHVSLLSGESYSQTSANVPPPAPSRVNSTSQSRRPPPPPPHGPAPHASGSGSRSNSPQGASKLQAEELPRLSHRQLVWVAVKTGKIYVYDTSTLPWLCIKDFKAHNLSTARVTDIVEDLLLFEDPWDLDFRNKWEEENRRSAISFDLMNSFVPWRVATLSVGESVGKDKASCLAVWDSTLRRTWVERHMRLYESNFSSYTPIGVHICSWNVDSGKPCDVERVSPDFLKSWLKSTRLSESPEVVICGFQELIDLESKTSNAKSILKGTKHKHAKAVFKSGDSKRYKLWQDAIELNLARAYGDGSRLTSSGNRGYRLVASRSLVGLFLLCYVRNDISCEVHNVETTEAKTGFGGLHGNKGAIISRFIIRDTSFCVAVAHLSAGQKELIQRGRDAATIFDSSGFKPLPFRHGVFMNGGDGRGILDHEVCFFFGDLNYRIDLPREKILSAIRENDWEALQNYDQLLVEKGRNPTLRLRGYDEGMLAFTPTYKYDLFTDQFDSSEKQRTPAWCDRILYRVSPAVHLFKSPSVSPDGSMTAHQIKLSDASAFRQLVYRRWDEPRTSDHRPISSEFQIRIKKVDDVQALRVFEGKVKKLWDDTIYHRHLAISMLHFLTAYVGYDFESSRTMVKWAIENGVSCDAVTDLMWQKALQT